MKGRHKTDFSRQNSTRAGEEKKRSATAMPPGTPPGGGKGKSPSPGKARSPSSGRGRSRATGWGHRRAGERGKAPRREKREVPRREEEDAAQEDGDTARRARKRRSIEKRGAPSWSRRGKRDAVVEPTRGKGKGTRRRGADEGKGTRRRGADEGKETRRRGAGKGKRGAVVEPAGHRAVWGGEVPGKKRHRQPESKSAAPGRGQRLASNLPDAGQGGQAGV